MTDLDREIDQLEQSVLEKRDGSDIHRKLASVMEKIGSLDKTERNKEQGFNFRSIEAITAHARPLLAKAGISNAPKLLDIESTPVESARGSKGYRTTVVMEYTFTAGSDGSSIVVSMPGEAVDYGDKSTSKAAQMAFKYALTQALLIGSGEADPDTQSPDVGRSESSRDSSRGRSRSRSSGEASKQAATDPAEGGRPGAREWGITARARLLEAVSGDKEKAKEIWKGLAERFRFSAQSYPPEAMLEEVSVALDEIVSDLLLGDSTSPVTDES